MFQSEVWYFFFLGEFIEEIGCLSVSWFYQVCWSQNKLQSAHMGLKATGKTLQISKCWLLPSALPNSQNNTSQPSASLGSHALELDTSNSNQEWCRDCLHLIGKIKTHLKRENKCSPIHLVLKKDNIPDLLTHNLRYPREKGTQMIILPWQTTLGAEQLGFFN